MLPGALALAARPAEVSAPVSSQRTISSVREFEKYQAPAPTAENFPWATTGPMDVPDGGHALTVSATAAPGPAPAIDQVHHNISACVLELKQVKAESMSVVLRPDAHTEVFIELRMHEGLVDVAAQCKRGDWAGLSAHWGELQHTLSGQGIRLGALEGSSSPHLNGQSSEDGFNPSNRHSSEREPSGKTFELEPFLRPARSSAREKLGGRPPATKRL
ncbi:MAG TPA: hypothetical protein VGK40_10475, partial [Verrucomicrobiae bacterium]